jgi:hypothetical protein
MVAGWCVALAAIGAIVVSGAAAADFGEGSAPTKAVSTLQLVFGVGLLGYVLWRAVRGRRRVAAEPRWMAGAERIGPLGAFGIGAFIPTYAIALAGLADLARSGVGPWAATLSYLVFVVVSAVGLAAPLIVVATSGGGSDERLAAWRAWLVAKSRTVVTVLLGALGVLLVVRGIQGLAS